VVVIDDMQIGCWQGFEYGDSPRKSKGWSPTHIEDMSHFEAWLGLGVLVPHKVMDNRFHIDRVARKCFAMCVALNVVKKGWVSRRTRRIANQI
jgi:hypothetical protein